MLGVKRWRRRKLRSAPFPSTWDQILRKTFPLYRRLSGNDRAELQGHIQVFLSEKRFEGCAGLEVTDEIKVTIAAYACLLLLHRKTDYYPGLSSILVYPQAYAAPVEEEAARGFAVEGYQERLGESWQRGAVVLAWKDPRSGATSVKDGRNLILHEFAHQLDHEDGVADGAPLLERRADYVTWARVLRAEYDRLRADSERGRRSVLDLYGATNPAEFFAVATESFFLSPGKLRHRHPELFDSLKRFYRQDPRHYSALPRKAGRRAKGRVQRAGRR